MKKLSDFHDEDAIKIVGKMLKPVCLVVSDERMKASRTNLYAFASALIEYHTEEVREILAALNEVDSADYHCTAETAFGDTIALLNDADMLQLFGLQMQTVTSSVSATETSEVME